MPILRGHHLICLHFFNGEGYNEAFIENLRETLSLTDKEDITISSGADDICTRCPWLKEGRCEYDRNADKEIREMDSKALELLGLSPGSRIKWQTLRRKIPGIFPVWFSLYCRECDWRGACEKDQLFKELKQDYR